MSRKIEELKEQLAHIRECIREEEDRDARESMRDMAERIANDIERLVHGTH